MSENKLMDGGQMLDWLAQHGIVVELKPVAVPAERITPKVKDALVRNRGQIMEALCGRYLAGCRATTASNQEVVQSFPREHQQEKEDCTQKPSEPD